MKTKAVIFDMDGVIAHTNPYHLQAFKIFFDRHQVSYTEEGFLKHMYGKHNSYIFKYFFGRPVSNEEILTFEQEKESLFREIYAEHAQVVDGLGEFLTELQQHDFALAVATAAPKANMDLVLDVTGIRHYFQSTLCSEDVKLHKPHPEVYLKSAENLGLQPEQCLVFEDSFSGATAGINAGMKVVGLLTTHRADELPSCEKYINNFNEINVKEVTSFLS